MLVWSQQHKIVSDISLSFKKLNKIHTKVSGSILQRDMMFLKEQKHSSRTSADFKFIVLWLVFKLNTSKIDTLKALQTLDKETIKKINKHKENITLYKNTLKNDFQSVEGKIITPKLALHMFKKNEVSCLYIYWYFLKDYELTRLEKRTVNRVKFFMSYFKIIEEYIINY